MCPHDQPCSFTAQWVFPVSEPPLPGGVVTLGGDRIIAVEPHGAPADVDLGNVALLPGLVNAHTHLDLSGLRGLAPPTPDFTAWLRRVIGHRRSRSANQVRADIRSGLDECLRFGTTLVGDIDGGGDSWDTLVSAPLRAVVFREMLGLTRERASRTWADADAWQLAHPATLTCRPAVSPHAPYSIRSSLFFGASFTGVPVALHLAETAAEGELLATHGGPFAAFLRDLGVWAPDGLADDYQHVLRLASGLHPVLVVHGNYLQSERLPENASLVCCPRTHAAFSHPPHPFREFLARGVRVALGTDSLASNPDLDVLAEARFLHRQYPDVAGDVLLQMATLSGAEALGWADETGSLTAGKSADLVVVPLPDRVEVDPHRLVLGTDTPVSAVLFRGRWVRGGPVSPPT